MMPTLELFSEVAVLRDLPEKGLARGQVGTVVEVFSSDAAEVEFMDDQGYTYAMTALRAEDLVQLRRQPLEQVA